MTFFRLFSYTLLLGSVVAIYNKPNGGALLLLLVSVFLVVWSEESLLHKAVKRPLLKKQEPPVCKKTERPAGKTRDTYGFAVRSTARHIKCNCDVPCQKRFRCPSPTHKGNPWVPWCVGSTDSDLCDECWYEENKDEP